jgi:hypothetical protein
MDKALYDVLSQPEASDKTARGEVMKSDFN